MSDIGGTGLSGFVSGGVVGEDNNDKQGTAGLINPDEIDIDDEDDLNAGAKHTQGAEADANEIELEEQPVPAAVFGKIQPGLVAQ